MSYPTYHISGTPLDDPRGRWNLIPGTQVLPSLPGLEQASYRVPGAAGETVVNHAPVQPTSRRLSLRFNAVWAGGVWASNASERMEVLAKNMSDFYSLIRVGASSHEGLMEIQHHLSATNKRIGYGRVVAGAEPSYDAGSDHAILELIIQIPSGRWYSPTADEVTATIQSGTNTITLPCGDAPQDTSEINVKGRAYLNASRPLTIRNEAGHGLKLVDSVGAGEYMLIKPRVWATTRYTSTVPKWGLPAQTTGSLVPHNRALGTGLAVYPSPILGKAQVIVEAPSLTEPLEMKFRLRKAWF